MTLIDPSPFGANDAIRELREHDLNCAAFCVFPNFIHSLKDLMPDGGTPIAVVSGNFPSGMAFSQIKTEESVLSEAQGADEIDIVINKGWAKEEAWHKIEKEVAMIKGALDHSQLKVILETGMLDPEQILQASQAAMRGGADFIKTSTGKIPNGASLEAIAVMSLAAKEHFEKTGRKVGIKASGGIAEVEDALRYIELVRRCLGSEWIRPELFRIGASRLLGNCLKELE